MKTFAQVQDEMYGLTWQEAVVVLAENDHYHPQWDDAVDRVIAELPGGHGDEQGDWIQNGSWDGTETIDQVVSNWEEYQTYAE